MINWQRLRELQDEIGTEDFDEVVDLFLEEVGCAVDRVASEHDLATLGDDLHFLKGSALSLGFDQFARLCQAGEMTAKQDAKTVEIEPIIACYTQSKATFLAEFRQQLLQ